jgi:hypothetical protein
MNIIKLKEQQTPVILCCFLFFFNMLSLAGFSQSKNIRKMLAVMRQEEKTWNNGDIEGYVNLYAPHDSTRMILGKGAAYGKDNILAFYKKYWPKEKMGTLVLDGERFEKLSRKFYYVTGYFHVSYPDGKKIEGRYSSLMKKIKGKWYIYTDHSG